MSLTYEQRPAAEVLDLAVDVLNETRQSATADRERCRWLYQDNPDGDATVWLARDGDVVAGFAALLPRRMRVDGEARRSWNTADLSVRARYRRQGIASALRSRARDAVDEGQVDFLYGNPNSRSEGAHRKAGYTELGEMRRHVKVLRARPYAQRVLPDVLAGAAAAVIDPLLRVADGEGWRRAENEVAPAPLRFDERFDELFATTVCHRRVVGVRDARYLSWRYGDNPVDDLRLLTATRAGRLTGYVVYRRVGQVAELLDLFPAHEPALAADLLVGLAAAARADDLASVSVTLLETHPLVPRLGWHGYRVRSERSRMFAYAPSTSPVGPAVTAGAGWLAVEGDRDV